MIFQSLKKGQNALGSCILPGTGMGIPLSGASPIRGKIIPTPICDKIIRIHNQPGRTFVQKRLLLKFNFCSGRRNIYLRGLITWSLAISAAQIWSDFSHFFLAPFPLKAVSNCTEVLCRAFLHLTLQSNITKFVVSTRHAACRAVLMLNMKNNEYIHAWASHNKAHFNCNKHFTQISLMMS